MPAARIPEEEKTRLAVLKDLKVLDTDPEEAFDQVVRLVAKLFDVPITLISLVDADRQWFKARVGLDALQTPRGEAFCAHAILADEPLLVPDATLDPRFIDNPLVLGAPDIRFYLGVPLITVEGARIGTLCVIDNKPQTPSPELVTLLQEQARVVVSHMELRRVARKLAARNSELAIANDKLKSFARALSHDIVAPIRHLQNFSELLAPLIPQEGSEEFAYMTRAIERLHMLVNSLGEYIDSSRQARLSEVSLEEVLDASMELVQQQLDQLGATVQVSPLPTVLAHPAHLQRVLSNLLDNAIKYRADRPLLIAISARRVDERWRVEVRDNGIGIEQRFLEQVFTPLERLHRQSAIPGSGLGLALCSQVITALGGTMGVESEPTVGSTFWFELPAYD